MMRAAAAILVVVAAFGTAAPSSCDQKRESKKIVELSDSLCEAAQDFNKLVVWHNYPPASLMVVPARRIDFLMEAESHAGSLQIEDFSIVVCQVSDAPPMRDLGLPSTEPPETAPPAEAPGEGRKFMDKEEAVEAVKQNPVPSTDKSLSNEGLIRKKPKETKEKDKIYYGTVLVRYINRSILPSASVDTKLMKQYWLAVGDVWYCDFDWAELLKR